MHLAIDFGTSYTKLGWAREGRFVNLAGGMQVPSVVTYLPSTGLLHFGPLALRLQEPGALTLPFFKLMLKRNPSLRLGPYSLPEILQQFFAYLSREYLEPGGVAPDGLLLSVPNYFGLRSRRLLLDAARAATGLLDIRLVPEPVAALLGHNDSHPGQALEGEVLCIDVGGGTTDFSFLSLSGHGRQILLETQLQIGNDAFSGSEMDRGMLRHIFFPAFTMQTGALIPDELIKEKNLAARDRFRLNRLMQKAEAVRIELSQKGFSRCELPDFYNGLSLIYELEPDWFDRQMEPVFARLRNYFLSNVKNKAERLGLWQAGHWNLDYVLLLGGASQTRGITEMINELCPGVMIISPQERDYAVVRGLCAWAEDSLAHKPSIKNIYPFEFYIEKKTDTAEAVHLEKIPFDTSNLELNPEETYPIFSFPVHSNYNLAAHPGDFHCRIYELCEGEKADEATDERFLGQEILLGTEEVYEISGDSVTVLLNLQQSRLELAGCAIETSAHKLADWWQDLPAHQRAASQLVKDYPFIDKRLKNDFSNHLQTLEDTCPYKSWDNTALYKMLCLIQILGGK